MSLDSNASIKSVKDAEREVAELRLAMVGMGKAMGEWLTSLAGQSEQACQQVSAREGLERVRDTLLDAAGKGVDEIVKEWGWHEGLEAPRSRDSTPNPLTAPEAALPNQPLPVPDEVVFDAEEITPTMPSFPVLEKPPQLPVNPAIMQSAPLQSHASGSKPPLYLSSRHDKPIATLPRVPITAPVQSQSISNSTALWPSRAASSISRRPVKREDEDGTEANLNGDPLAGVGVSALKADETRRRTAVDPLLGVGVR